MRKTPNEQYGIQFNSKTLFKDGDPISFKTYLPWGHPNMKTNTTIIHTYIKTKQVHQKITGKHNLHFHTKHKHSYLTYTIYTIHDTLYH